MSTPEAAWQTYLAQELPIISGLLSPYHIELLSDQPHIKGERFLIQALTTIGGKKLILLGTDTRTNQNVVIKATNDPLGKAELRHERRCRSLLHAMNFSYESFHSPKELYFFETQGYVIYIGAFIEQSSSFLERPIEEQFSFALQALKAQERTRATTATHLRNVRGVFGTRTSSDYLRMTDGFITHIKSESLSENILTIITTAKERLEMGKERIEQYCGFLTHTDFVPHNFRIKDNVLYLLDFSSLRIGNKHESWARFLNFMTLYNPLLESLLLTYVQKNRSSEEQESLHLMRLFRLIEIIAYYVGTKQRSVGNLHELNHARIEFWSEVLKAELSHTTISPTVTTAYRETRDRLRSDDEKERQRDLH
jgi:serine/threonine protein kinase